MPCERSLFALPCRVPACSCWLQLGLDYRRGACLDGDGLSTGCLQWIEAVLFAIRKAIPSARLGCNDDRGVHLWQHSEHAFTCQAVACCGSLLVGFWAATSVTIALGFNLAMGSFVASVMASKLLGKTMLPRRFGLSTYIMRCRHNIGMLFCHIRYNIRAHM